MASVVRGKYESIKRNISPIAEEWRFLLKEMKSFHQGNDIMTTAFSVEYTGYCVKIWSNNVKTMSLYLSRTCEIKSRECAQGIMKS